MFLKKLGGVLATCLLSMVPLVMPAATAQTPSCHVWNGIGDLQTIVNTYACVELVPGTYLRTTLLKIPTNHTIRGQTGQRSTTIVRATTPWQEPWYSWREPLVEIAAGGTAIGFTIDAANISTNGVSGDKYTVDNVAILNAHCDGADIGGPGVTIRNSLIAYNGSNCTETGIPGGAIYSQRTNGYPDYNYAPLIENNVIRDNGGPALDINGTWGGTFRNNTVSGNQHWAAVSLFGASYWHIENNTITHAATNDTVPQNTAHSQCIGGPSGGHSAGIWLCQVNDTNNFVTIGNVITGNVVQGWYGILAIGNDETQPYWAPRLNTFQYNNVLGSTHGCADDFNVGPTSPWYTERNVWTGNNCVGTPNTGPTFF
ncbi:right-handed parallel beta-helix repeat-containing protein [Herpetosiphon gulosus]|uniref:Right handed beta helix domain-containing protein n=1 Tax=Herpetosiphon gulosus TaxID=1973496 RepID=A0ABP9WYK1_9CHLR